jgi:hypothetical protein
MDFRELNPGSLISIKQRFLKAFSDKIEEELEVKEIKCPLCSKHNVQVWIKILDTETYADSKKTPYAIIGEIDHCTCMNCGIIFFPIKVKPKEKLPGNYTSYPHLYHFCVSVRYSIDHEQLQRLLRI